MPIRPPADRLSEVAGVSEQFRTAPPPLAPVTPRGRMDDVRAKREEARRVEALSLRLAGLSYEQIGNRLSISIAGARDLVTRSLAEAENQGVEEMRSIENSRLDRAQAAIWSGVLEGDIRSVATFLKISERRSRLNGMDAPTKINLSLTVRQEMEAALAELEQMVLHEVVDAVDPD